MREKPDCGLCKKTFELSGKEPENCSDCLPKLDDDLVDIIEVYNVCKYQYIVGFSGAIDINIMAINTAIDIMMIPEKLRKFVFMEVLKLCRNDIANMQQSRH